MNALGSPSASGGHSPALPPSLAGFQKPRTLCGFPTAARLWTRASSLPLSWASQSAFVGVGVLFSLIPSSVSFLSSPPSGTFFFAKFLSSPPQVLFLPPAPAAAPLARFPSLPLSPSSHPLLAARREPRPRSAPPPPNWLRALLRREGRGVGWLHFILESRGKAGDRAPSPPQAAGAGGLRTQGGQDEVEKPRSLNGRGCQRSSFQKVLCLPRSLLPALAPMHMELVTQVYMVDFLDFGGGHRTQGPPPFPFSLRGHMKPHLDVSARSFSPSSINPLPFHLYPSASPCARCLTDSNFQNHL